MSYERVCPVCKAKFVTDVFNKIYCSKNCKKRASMLRYRGKAIDTPKKYNLARPITIDKKSGSGMTIEEVAIEAMKLDLSYGYYVGKYE